MIDYRTNMSSYDRALRSEMSARERELLNGAKGLDGTPLPSQFAQACAARQQQAAREALLERIATSLSVRRLG